MALELQLNTKHETLNIKMIKDYFKIDKNPKKGLLPLEWVVLGYMAITLITMLFTYTKVVNPESMLWGRLRVLAMTIALWGVYRMIPCRVTKMIRIMAQIALLAWWYPDTYEINRMFPNLDHVFAGWEVLRIPTRLALRQGDAMGGGERTNVDGLFYVLPDDSGCGALLFLL